MPRHSRRNRYDTGTVTLGGGTTDMLGLKRFVRPDVVFSAIGHVGVLLLSLLAFGAGEDRRAPPEAMTVEIVPPSEAPPFETPQTETPQNETPQAETPHVDGTPLESKSTGSEVSSNSEKGSASAAPPKPKMAAPPSPELTQPRSNPQRSASLATQPPAASPEEPQPETQPQASEPLLRPTIQTDRSEPQPEEARTQPDVGEMFALPLALPGGRLGGGFDAPSADPAMLPHDDIAAFRARASSCTRVPAGTAIDENVRVVLRVSFKPDGTLASQPWILDASFLPGTSELIQAAVSALEKCQPYAELPKDKYNEWKSLDLIVTPRMLSGL
jgi:hypothetical protein